MRIPLPRDCQAVDKAASPALVLINGNKSLRMAMMQTLR